MKQEEIIQNNKLIAEFMNLNDQILSIGSMHSWNDSPFYYTTEDSKEKVIENIAKYAKYHSSWDWLMPVVEKIESLRIKGKYEKHNNEIVNCEYLFTVVISDKQCIINNYIIPQYYGIEEDLLKLYDCRNTSKIDAVYKAVIEFIKWYNENTSKLTDN